MFIFSGQSAHAAWTEPSASPPGGNVAAPLNISSTAQTKAGELIVQGIFRAQGGLEASGGSGSFPISATAPVAPAGTVTGGVVGYGASAVGTGISVGAYGISVETPGGGTHVGLLGVAGANSGNSVGVYGWNGNNASAYAGYFLGRVGIDGELCLNNDCRQTWPEGGPGGGSSLFTENPQNNTYLTNTGSNLAIGGTQGNDAAFFFTVSPQANRGVFYTEKSIVIGAPLIVTENDGICSVGEACGQENVDCWGQQDGCTPLQICDPAGSGQCVASDAIPPTPPGQMNVDGQPSAGVVPLLWQASSDQGGSGLTGYKIYRCEGPSCMPTVLLVDTHDTATAYADTTVVPNQTYRYLAKAYDGADNLSDASNILLVTTPAQGDTTPPTTPENLHVNGPILANQVPLAWDASTDDGGSGLYGYKVYRCEGVGCTPALYDVVGLGTTYDDSGVSSATVYVYRVSAFDADGNESALSPSLQITTPSDGIAPSIPQNFRFPGQLGVESIPLAWDASTDDGGSGLAGYKIYRCEGVGCTPTIVVHTLGTATTYLDVGLTEGATYNYEISAFDNAQNESGRSNRLEGTPSADGGSPAILKGGDGTPPGGGSTGAATPPNGGISRSSFTTPETEPLVTGAAPLSRLLRVPTAQAKLGFFAIPDAQAADPFGGNPNTRLMVNDGVVQIKDAGGNTMELGNSGSDIASSTMIVVRPNTIPRSQGAEFFSVSGHTQLRLTGAIEIGAGTSQNAGMIQFNANTNDFEGYDGTQWKSFTTGGGGAVSNSDQVIWNTLAGTPLGGFPQTGGFHLTQQGIVNSFIAGPTYANPPTDYTITGASLFVNGSNSTVGINTVAPNASYKLDVSGDANATRLCIAGDCRAIWPSGGGGGLDGNGTANAIPMWFDVDTLTSSAIFQEGTNISIGDQSAAYPLDVVGQANAAELGLDGDFISGWDELILNQLTPAQPANFNITGSGTIETKLTVGETLELPTYNRTSYASRIDRNNTALEGYYISSKYVFGAEPGNPWGMGFFTDDLPDSPIVVINRDREVHLGYVGAATDLCLYGSGVRECRDSWPSGGGAVANSDQVIWNTLAVDPLGGFPQTGGFHLTQQGIVNSFIAGPTYANPPEDYTITGAKLFVGNSNSKVGIGTIIPADQLSIDGTAPSALLSLESGGSTRWHFGIMNAAGDGLQFGDGATMNARVTILKTSGNVGIGDSSPLALLTVGNGDLFRVNSSGNLIRINNVAYTWPTGYNGGGKYLRTDNAGNLTWEDAVGSGGITGSGTIDRIPKFLTGTSLTDSVIYESGSRIAISAAPDASGETFQLQDGGEWGGFGYDDVSNLLSMAVHAGSEIQTFSIDYDDPVFNFGTASVGNALSIEKLGDVGIGDSTPDAKLDVAGNALLTPSALDPDTYNTRTIIAQISDNSWIANGMAFGSASGSAAAIGALAGNFYLGMQNGANTMTTFLQHIAATRSTLFPASGGVQIGVNGQDGKLTLFSEGTTDYTVIFQPHGTQTQNTTYTLPENDGNSGQFLSTDGTGALSWAAAGGGAVSNSDQVIWNTLAGTPLGSFPQTGGFHLTQQGITSSFVAGPTYLNPPSDYTITNATLYVSGPGPDGKVGIHTLNPQGALHIRSNLDSIVLGGDQTDNIALLGIASNFSPNQALTLEGKEGIRFLYSGGGTEAMRVASGGNVGIGTTNPQAKLQVTGGILRVSDNGDNAIESTQGASRYPLIGTYSGWEANTVYVAGYNVVNAPGSAQTTAVSVGGSGSETLRVNFPNRNVGIGTTNPNAAYKLQVAGNVLVNDGNANQAVRNSGVQYWNDKAFGAELHFGQGGAQSAGWATALYGRTTDSVALRLGAYPADATQPNQLKEYLTIMNSGSIGINQYAPQAKLTVNNNLPNQGNANDGIGVYADTLSSALYAQQNNASGRAAYFSGKSSGGESGVIPTASAVYISNTATSQSGAGLESHGGVGHYSTGVIGIGENVSGASPITIGVYGGTGDSTGTNGIMVGVYGAARIGATNLNKSYGVYGWAQGGQFSWAGYFFGKVEITDDLILNGNVWGTVDNATNRAYSGNSSCSRAQGTASTGCLCPGGYYMVGFTTVNGSNNDFSISCAKL